MPRARDQQEFEATQAQIKAVARAEMAKHGTAGLSLRAIARDMAVTAPALYRYYSSLDDLISALIVDGFNAAADAVEAADAGIANRADFEARLIAAAQAYRWFARSQTIDFMLIYGNPIPGYTAPQAVTVPAATRINIAFTTILVEAERAGAYRSPYHGALALDEAGLQRTRAISAQFGPSAEIIAAGLALWGLMQGLIFLELFGHLGPVIDAEMLYITEVRRFWRG